MKFPEVTPRSEGTVPVAVASGPMLEDREVIQVPWYKASVLHRKGVGHFENPIGLRAEAEKVQIDPAVVEAKQARLPKVVRRTARERAEVLATQLFQQGLHSQAVNGRVIWPASIEERLTQMGVQDKPLYEQVDALVGHFMLRSENQQKEKDSHKVTLDYHGHFD